MSDRTERDCKKSAYATPRRKTLGELPRWMLGISSALIIAAVTGGAGWLTSLASAQTEQAEKQAVTDEAIQDVRRRLERIENKVDALLLNARKTK